MDIKEKSKKERKTKSVLLKLAPSVYEMAKSDAKKQGLSFNAYVITLMEKALENLELRKQAKLNAEKQGLSLDTYMKTLILADKDINHENLNKEIQRQAKLNAEKQGLSLNEYMRTLLLIDKDINHEDSSILNNTDIETNLKNKKKDFSSAADAFLKGLNPEELKPKSS